MIAGPVKKLSLRNSTPHQAISHQRAISYGYKLTDYVQVHDVAHVRRRGDLTLVKTAVPKLRILDLQHPVVRVYIVDRLEPLIVRVRVTTDGQQVDVPVPDPGDL